MGLYVVSGCPRSGTSLMMDCFRVALGEDRLVGQQFPYEHRMEKQRNKQRGESDAEYAFRCYCMDNLKDPDNEAERIEKSRDMNPNGFWEHGNFTCGGITYKFQHRHALREMLEADPPQFIKIVSQGLIPSDPTYLDKIVFMVRHPFAVAKSQERLRREGGLFKTAAGKEVDLFSDLVINSPEMFIRVTGMAARFFLASTGIEVLMVDFDDLIEDPETQLMRVQEFLGEGDFKAAVSRINPKLRRSYPDIDGHAIWDEAKTAYNLLREQQFPQLVRLTSKAESEINKRENHWLCVRHMQPMVRAHCMLCKSMDENGKQFRDSLKDLAEDREIDWRNQPCAFEVAFDVDGSLISIEESVSNNFWKEDDDDDSARQSMGSRGLPGASSLRCTRALAGLRPWPQYRGQRRAGGPSPTAG